MKYDVLGIGNPIVDITAEINEAFLKENFIDKGVMNLIDKERADILTKKAKDGLKSVGGSVVNTVVSLSFLRMRCSFLGKIGKDNLGDFYKNSMTEFGIDFPSIPEQGDLTGRSIIFITSDAERSMNTYLGACSSLCADDINEDVIKESSLVFGEGYLFDNTRSKEALLKAFDIASKAKKITALTLSDKMCIKRSKKDFLELINSKKINVLFANEEEMAAFYGDNWQDLSEFGVDEVIATMGSKGAMSIIGKKRYYSCAKEVKKIVDTTGAGDLFATGYLYGILSGHPPEQRLENGVICSSEIISHHGTRPKKELTELI